MNSCLANKLLRESLSFCVLVAGLTVSTTPAWVAAQPVVDLGATQYHFFDSQRIYTVKPGIGGNASVSSIPVQQFGQFAFYSLQSPPPRAGDSIAVPIFNDTSPDPELRLAEINIKTGQIETSYDITALGSTPKCLEYIPTIDSWALVGQSNELQLLYRSAGTMGFGTYFTYGPLLSVKGCDYDASSNMLYVYYRDVADRPGRIAQINFNGGAVKDLGQFDIQNLNAAAPPFSLVATHTFGPSLGLTMEVGELQHGKFIPLLAWAVPHSGYSSSFVGPAALTANNRLTFLNYDFSQTKLMQFDLKTRSIKTIQLQQAVPVFAWPID